ncbi:MAG: sterol carrier protein domain-containing protein [Micrococcaceae bacterium]
MQVLLHEDGYAIFNYVDGGKGIKLHEVISTTIEAEQALWKVICAHDIAKKLTVSSYANMPLKFMLNDIRALKTTETYDAFWLRINDAETVLSSLETTDEGQVTLAVTDPYQDTKTVYEFSYVNGKAKCIEVMDSKADIELNKTTLASIITGAVTATEHYISGNITGSETAARKLATAIVATVAPRIGTYF